MLVVANGARVMLGCLDDDAVSHDMHTSVCALSRLLLLHFVYLACAAFKG